MPIENINLLQNNIDLKGLMRDNDYYVQALANLGQRTSLNSQSIKYNTFTFSDVFANSNDLYSPDTYIGTMTNNDDSIQFSIVDKQEISENYHIFNSVRDSIEEHNVSDKLLLNNNVSFNITVNNVDKISSVGSVISVKDGYFVSNLRTKLLGTDDKDDDNIEAQWTKINLNTGALHSAIRVFHLKDNNYVMLTITPSTSDEHIQYYNLSCYIVNTDTIVSDSEIDRNNIIDVFKSFFKYTSTRESIQEYCSNNLCDKSVDELLYFSDEDSPTNIYAFMKKYSYYDKVENYTISLQYDTLKNVRLSISDGSVLSPQYNNIEEIMKYDTLGLYHRISCVNDDIEITFPNLLNLWTTNIFNHDHTTFVRRIFIKLYEKLFGNYVDDLDNNVENKPCMFIPLNYKFNYISDGSDILYLYYTDDLYVSMINLSQLNKQELYEFLLKHDNIIFNYNDIDKVKIFNIFTQRNKKYDEYIDNIFVNERYTLPYVNAQNSWQINDVDTHIRAVGLNAGKPNIIILKKIYDENVEEHYEVLHSSDLNILQQCDEQKIDKLDEYFPVINAKNIDLFENALIIYIFNDNTKFYHVEGTDILEVYENPIDEIPLTIKSLFNVEKTILQTISDNDIAKSNKFKLITFNDDTNLNNQQVDGGIMHYALKQQRTDASNNKLNAELFIYRGDTLDAFDEENNIINDVELTGDKYLNKYIQQNNPDNICVGKDEYDEYDFVTEHVQLPAEKITEDTSDEQLINMIRSEYYGMFVTSIISNGVYEINNDYIDYIVSGYKHENNQQYDEYIPTSHIPMLKLSDVMLRDTNIVNRSNIIAFAPSGDMYYSYLGTSFEDEDKSTLHIGTGEKNINIGDTTLATPDYIDKFKKQDKLSIDFEEILLNTRKLKSNSSLVELHEVGETTYMTIKPNVFGLCGSNQQDTIQYTPDGSFIDIDNNPVVYERLQRTSDNMFVMSRQTPAEESNEDKYFLNLNKLLKEYDIDLSSRFFDALAGDNNLELYYNNVCVDGNNYDPSNPIENIKISKYSVDGEYRYSYLLYVGNKQENVLSTIGGNINLHALYNIYLTLWYKNNTLCVDIQNRNSFTSVTIRNTDISG